MANKIWAYYGRMGDEAAGPEMGCELFPTKEEAYRSAFDEMFYEEGLFEEEIDQTIRAVLDIGDTMDPEIYYWREKFDTLTFAQQVEVLEAVRDSLSYNIDRIFEVYIQELTLPAGIYVSAGEKSDAAS